MKKSNVSLNKTIVRKDFLNGLSAFTVTLIFVFGVLLFLGTLAPSVTNGKLVFGLTQRVARGDELSYIFDCNDVLSLVSLAVPFVIASYSFELSANLLAIARYDLYKRNKNEKS